MSLKHISTGICSLPSIKLLQVTQTFLSCYSFHFLLLGQAGSVITAAVSPDGALTYRPHRWTNAHCSKNLIFFFFFFFGCFLQATLNYLNRLKWALEAQWLPEHGAPRGKPHVCGLGVLLCCSPPKGPVPLQGFLVCSSARGRTRGHSSASTGKDEGTGCGAAARWGKGP